MKGTMFRKAVWIGMIMLMVILLAACGGKPADPQPSSQPSSGPSTSPGQSEQPGSGTNAAEPEKPQPEQSSVKVGLPVKVATFLPIYLADSKNYFKEEGLNVEIFEFSGDAGVVQALAGGSVDINVASPIGLVNSIKGGQNFKVFWGGFNHSDISWISPTLTSFDDAKGKRFGVTTYGSLTDLLTRYALKKHGFDPDKDVEILQVGPSYQAFPALEAGQIDVSTTSTPNNFVAEEKGMHYVLKARESIAPTWPQHVIYARERYIQNNPETIKAFIRAVSRATELIQSNPEEAVQELVNRLKFTEEVARKSVDILKPDFDSMGVIDPRGMEVFWEIAVDSGEVDQPWSDEQWLDPTFMNTASEWLK